MDFFKAKAFQRSRKQKARPDTNPDEATDAGEAGFEADGPGDNNGGKAENAAAVPGGCGGGEMEEDEDEDDDFITNEVKRRLKELRKNSFMVLIPEDSCLKDEEEEGEEEDGDTSSSDLVRDSAAELHDVRSWEEFDALYGNYCQRMVFFDKTIAKQLNEPGSKYSSISSPKSASKKLAMTFRSLSFKRKNQSQDDTQHHLLENQEENPYQNLETAYIAHLCLSWELLHCQYMLLARKTSLLPENFAYSHIAQSFQQFQVLLQRYIENEPFEEGSRVDVYARNRRSLCKLLQVPSFQGSENEEKQDVSDDDPILASDLLKAMEESILTFYDFLKIDKNKSSGSLVLFGNHNQSMSTLQFVRSSVDKKESKLKELCKKTKSWKHWPERSADVELLFGLIDVKVVLRVLRMTTITKEQLLWCEEKMSKLDISEERFRRNCFPVLFPC